MEEHIAKGCVSKNTYWIILQKFTVIKNVYLKTRIEIYFKSSLLQQCKIRKEEITSMYFINWSKWFNIYKNLLFSGIMRFRFCTICFTSLVVIILSADHYGVYNSQDLKQNRIHICQRYAIFIIKHMYFERSTT